MDDEHGRPLSRQDLAVLIGILASVNGEVLSGQLDENVTRKLAERFVRVGLLAREPDGQLPTAGRLGVAMEDLTQRVRYAFGDYDVPPASSPEATAHVIRFSDEAPARDCAASLAGDAQDTLVRNEDDGRWWLYAVYPELPPDEGFREREQQLRQVVARYGGTYAGCQGPPTDG